MYTIEQFYEDLENPNMEIVFDFHGGRYFISKDLGKGPDGAPIYYDGPENKGYAWNADEVLHTLLLDGKPMIERMDEIEYDGRRTTKAPGHCSRRFMLRHTRKPHRTDIIPTRWFPAALW